MQKIELDYSTALISQQEIETYYTQLKPEIQCMQEALSQKYRTKYASLNMPFDHQLMQEVESIVAKKKLLNPSTLVVIGIGGSSLGIIAIQEFLQGTLYNAFNPPLKVYYAETIDPDYLANVLRLVKQELEQSNRVILNVITKSGTTTETIANFELFLDLIKQYHPHDYHEYIVATTDRNSALWKLSCDQNFTLIEVPKAVGGRYSIFAVGIFPLGMLGISIEQLVHGAQSAVRDSTCLEIAINHAALEAAIIYAHYLKKIAINDLFLFGVDAESLGKWYRQLMGETIGKEHDLLGNQVFRGITPTVSIGTTDLHSVGQLYLGGPYDKFWTFVFFTKNKHELTLPDMPIFEHCVSHIQGKPLSDILKAVYDGVTKAYAVHQRPYCTIVMPEKNAYYVAQFMQYQMIKMIYLSSLLSVDPFDQPQVELYKQETRKILSQ